MKRALNERLAGAIKLAVQVTAIIDNFLIGVLQMSEDIFLFT